MKTAATVAIVLLLAGCDGLTGEPITNDQYIADADKCRAAGLGWREIQNSYYVTVRIQCKAPDSP